MIFNITPHMLRRIAPKFIISRVIQYSHFAEAMSIEVLKQPFGTHFEYFRSVDSKNYYEVSFYGYLSTLSKPTEFANRYEERAYDEACDKFATFNEVNALVEKVNDFSKEIKCLYNQVQRNISNSNIFSHKSETDADLEADIIDALSRYNKLIDDLEAYPEWKDKVTQEVGKWFHLIHNNLAQSESKRKVFSHMNRQEYFI